jgi:hypothetical protein
VQSRKRNLFISVNGLNTDTRERALWMLEGRGSTHCKGPELEMPSESEEQSKANMAKMEEMRRCIHSGGGGGIKGENMTLGFVVVVSFWSLV